MEYVVLIFVFALAAVYFALWCWIRCNRNGFREGMTEIAVGQLTKQIVQRKASSGTFGDKTHKKTQFTYSYQVKGVTYDCDCTLLDHFKPLPASTKVVYQRKRPQMAYLPEFEDADVKGMATFYLWGSIFFLLLGLIYVIIAL